MKKSNSSEVKRGQAISFRIPSDTPDHLLKQLQILRETERRNFSSKVAEFVMEGVNQSFTRERETITLPLPHKLSKSQRNWLKHEHSEALLGSIVYQLLTDPVRATAILATLNSKSIDIDEALYLQEEPQIEEQSSASFDSSQEIAATKDSNDDIDNFNWEDLKTETVSEQKREEENDLESLLGDFLASMNK